MPDSSAHVQTQTYRGFPVMEQVRVSESPSRKIPEGGTIRTVGATAEKHKGKRVYITLQMNQKNHSWKKKESGEEKKKDREQKRGKVRTWKENSP